MRDCLRASKACGSFGSEDFEVAVVMAGEAVRGMVLRGYGLRLRRFGAR